MSNNVKKLIINSNRTSPLEMLRLWLNDNGNNLDFVWYSFEKLLVIFYCNLMLPFLEKLVDDKYKYLYEGIKPAQHFLQKSYSHITKFSRYLQKNIKSIWWKIQFLQHNFPLQVTFIHCLLPYSLVELWQMLSLHWARATLSSYKSKSKV